MYPGRFCQVLLMLACAAALGCNKDPLKKVNVSGTVTFDGGPCPAPGRVNFSPIEVAEGLPSRMASGKFDVDGKYEVKSFRPGDGIVPGKYLVAVICVDSSKLSSVPSDQEYRDATYIADSYEPHEIVIELGSDKVTHDIDLPRR